MTKQDNNKTEVTSVKLVLFKYVMSFEILTKVDQLTENLWFLLGFKPKNSSQVTILSPRMMNKLIFTTGVGVGGRV